MIKIKNSYLILKFILLLLIAASIFSQYIAHPFTMLLLFALILSMTANEYLRNRKSEKQNKYFYISLFFSIYSAAALEYFVSGQVSAILMYAYMYIFLFEILLLKKDIMKFFFSVNLLLLILAHTLNYDPLSLNIKLLAFIVTSIFYSAIIIRNEKKEIEQLNEKLKSANLKLQEYAMQIEDTAIYKERTRVAQELHDSLGHSLMALAMHLEFANKIYSTKPEKVEEVLSQSEKLTKASINDLRKAVDALKSELEITDFNASVKALINNFSLISDIKINYNYNYNVESLNPIIKTAVYKTIQEAVTNSLKHGNATEIIIKTAITNENLELVITDNGTGCSNIIKSNGLNGIEKRISFLGGTTNCFSHNNLGFGIKVSIPA